MIHVTKPYLPNREKLEDYINEIYQSGLLTNNGPLVQRLEQRLKTYLGVEHLILISNGTNALQVALKSLKCSGEVITTPFSFSATSQAIDFIGCTPIFSDIDKETFNLTPSLCEQKINKLTSAIMPVHVFGNPCDIDGFKKIAKLYSVPIIYDAAHCFDVNFKDQSILNYGDISIISFHATKIFHCIEGGAIITNNKDTALSIRKVINFGLNYNQQIEGPGTNAKMNEFEAAMGLAVMDELDEINQKREKIWEVYSQNLKGLVTFQTRVKYSTNNYSYAPILLQDEKQLLQVKAALEEQDIFPRRYFYPCLNTQKNDNSTPIAQDISQRILCLPLFPSLDITDVNKIITIIKMQLKNQ